MTSEFEKINESIYSMTWYILPVEVQKKLPAMMATAQREVYLQGFAEIHCSFIIFAKVIIYDLVVVAILILSFFFQDH